MFNLTFLWENVLMFLFRVFWDEAVLGFVYDVTVLLILHSQKKDQQFRNSSA